MSSIVKAFALSAIVGLLVGASMGVSLAAAPATTASGSRAVISDHGAVADGKTINTSAIQKTIDDTAAGGGGTIVVPHGTFLTGALFLKPGVALDVEKDGILKGSANIADYPMTRTRIEGHFQLWTPALVNAQGIDHLRIGGEGMLDGSGVPFYAAFHTRIRADRSTANLDVPRPRMIFISDCADARIEGLHLLNSAFWNLHVYHSHDVLIEGLDITAPADSPSTDGIDIDCSQSITVHRCRIANHDDGIALKGPKGLTAGDNPLEMPDEKIHVYDCTFERGDSFVTCGSEASTVRDVEVDHCKSAGNGPAAMLRLKLRTDTPQLYENIRFHDIALTGRVALIDIAPWNQYADLKGQAPPSHMVRNITLSNITGSCGSFGSIRTKGDDQVQNIVLENIDLHFSKPVPALGGMKFLQLKNVKFNGSDAR